VHSSISHYAVLDPLGSGGNGVVYRAEDTGLHRTVALKFLQNRAGANDRGRERLRREARTASALNHPNICSTYEAGDQDGEIFIAMEFIDGRPLSKLAKQEGMAPSSVILHGMQIAGALEPKWAMRKCWISVWRGEPTRKNSTNKRRRRSPRTQAPA